MSSVTYAIVAYKSNDILPPLLNSIHRQQGTFSRQIVIVDNFAAENCTALVQESGVTAKLILNEKNLGYTAAVNQAISEASGDVVFLLNPDIELDPDCTKNLLNALNGDSRLAAVAPQLLNRDGSIQSSVRNFPTFSTVIWEHTGLARLLRNRPVFGRWKNLYFDHNTRTNVAQPMASALMIRREVLTRLGPWDEQFFIYFSDVDYCRRIIASGAQILFEPAARAAHALGGSTRKERGWLIRDSHRGFYRYLRKHELRGNKALLRPFAWLVLRTSAEIRIYWRELLHFTSPATP